VADTDTNAVGTLAHKYFTDLESDKRVHSRDNLRAWLWFSCPADLRGPVGEAIEEMLRDGLSQDDIRKLWGESTTPIYDVLDELTGERMAAAQIRRCGEGPEWIYTDDVNGCKLLGCGDYFYRLLRDPKTGEIFRLEDEEAPC